MKICARDRRMTPLTCAMALLISLTANAQTSRPGDSPGAAQHDSPDTRTSSPATPPTPDTPQPAYPSSNPPRGTTPQQRQRAQQEGEREPAMKTRCDQKDELARSECLRRDMTDDDDRPAGMTRSMQQRRQEREAEATESLNVASEADTGSDQVGARSRTRTASSDVPEARDQRESTPGEDSDGSSEQPATDANNDSDTLGRER